jgi:hypothetical protein
MQGEGRYPDWVGVVAGIRAGDESAISQLEEIFGGGIRFFLRRTLGQHELDSRQRQVLGLVIESIRKTSTDEPIRIASYVLTALREYTGSQMRATPNWGTERESRVTAIREVLDKITAEDMEALHRYYVDKETEEQICRALNITSARFRAIRAGVRSRLTESKRNRDEGNEARLLVLTGKRRRLKSEIAGIESKDGNQTAVRVPAGSLIDVTSVEVTSGPTQKADAQMIEVLWEGRRIVMLAEEVQRRSDEIPVAQEDNS